MSVDARPNKGSHEPATDKKSGEVMRPRLALALALVVVVLLAGVLAWYFVQIPSSSAHAPAAASQAVPVTASLAKKDNVPVYRTGLGTVQAFNTVTVKVRVDGQLNTRGVHRRSGRQG